MRLIETWLADPERAFDLFAKFPAEETGFENPAAGMNRERSPHMCEGCVMSRLASACRTAGCQPPNTFSSTMRATMWHLQPASPAHRLPAQRSGPHRYGVAREYRGHGYATAGLKLTLAKARELGIEEAYLSVHKTNPASLAVQQHCGARIDHEDKTEYYTRIATCMESDGLYARGD